MQSVVQCTRKIRPLCLHLLLRGRFSRNTRFISTSEVRQRIMANPHSAADAAVTLGANQEENTNFLVHIVEEDLASGKHKSIITRFPPEPNGFLHLGHAKSICLNFGLAKTYGGRCHLRFDDTNPTKEETRYIESIQRDVRWMGGDWGEHLYYASDYFQQLYDWAEDLIRKDLAFVDFDTPEQIKLKRGSITQPGEESSYKHKFTVEENLKLFREMRDGHFEEGQCVLRAKIDMAHSNINMRDPIIYRILKKEHPRTGNKWCIYPMYDYAHGQSDSIEKITHSICTLEFDLHRALYDWFQEKLGIVRTRQIEFARLNLTYTVMSKRKLLALVTEKYVDGWDDPRLSTLSAMRRRGVPPQAIQEFCERVGVSRRESTIQVELFEKCIRECLHKRAKRRFAVQDPLLVKITNFPADREKEFVTVPNHPEDETFGSRELAFTKELYIERSDFMLEPPKDFFRLAPGKEVRLKYAYWIKCYDVEKDSEGRVSAVLCTFDPETKNMSVAADGRKVKGTIHWLPVSDSSPAEFRIYGRLFTKALPEEQDPNDPESTWRNNINPKSLQVFNGFVEKDVADEKLFPPQSSIQFERIGFFTPDGPSEFVLGTSEGYARPTGSLPVFNLTINLAESFTVCKEKEDAKRREKEREQEARRKAAEERQRKKEERELAKKKKEMEKLQKKEDDGNM